MEARAMSLGPHVPKLHYMFPAGNHNFDTPQSRAQAKAAGLPIERLMPDVHVGASGAVEAAAALFEQAGPTFPMSAINCETNAGSHDLLRALNEAADLMDWMNSPTAITDRLYARTASFCTGGSSQFDSWDQVRSTCTLSCLCLLELRMSRPGPHIDCHRLGVTRYRSGHQLLPRQHDVAPYVAQQPAAPFGAHAMLSMCAIQARLDLCNPGSRGHVPVPVPPPVRPSPQSHRATSTP